MRVELGEYTCVVTKEQSDPQYPHTAAGESRLLHHIKQALQAQGHDVIKKRMWRDGHLVDDLQQYIRTRKPPLEGKEDPAKFFIYDPGWNTRFGTEEFNKGELVLQVVR